MNYLSLIFVFCKPFEEYGVTYQCLSNTWWDIYENRVIKMHYNSIDERDISVTNELKRHIGYVDFIRRYSHYGYSRSYEVFSSVKI